MKKVINCNFQRFPPDGEDCTTSMESGPISELPHRLETLANPSKAGELGWICLSVKWGYGGRIEVRFGSLNTA